MTVTGFYKKDGSTRPITARVSAGANSDTENDHRRRIIQGRRSNVLDTMQKARALGFNLPVKSEFLLKKDTWSSFDGSRSTDYNIEHKYFGPTVTKTDGSIHEPYLYVRGEIRLMNSEYGAGVKPVVYYRIGLMDRWFTPYIGKFEPRHDAKIFVSGDARIEYSSIDFKTAKAGIPKIKKKLDAIMEQAMKQYFNGRGFREFTTFDSGSPAAYERHVQASEELKKLLEKVYTAEATNTWAEAVARSKEKGQL